MTTPHRNRQPAGIPVGGQFATTAHAEPAGVHMNDQSGSIPASAPGAWAAAFGLGQAGLQGDVTLYTGGNPDAAEGALAYVSPRGHELVISGAGTDNLTIHHFDPTEENTFTTERTGCEDPAKAVEAIEDVLWDLETRDVFTAGFYDGEVFETREVELGRTGDGTSCASMTVRDEGDNELYVSHDYDTGKTTLSSERGELSGLAQEAALDALIVDMAEESEDGNNEVAAARAFERIRSAALKLPGAEKRLAPRKESDTKAGMRDLMEHVQNRDSTTGQQARNAAVLATGAQLGLEYINAVTTVNAGGDSTSAAMYAIGAAALAPLPGRLEADKHDTAAMREHIRKTQETLRKTGSLLDGFAVGGRQPVFLQLDNTLTEMDEFLVGP
ncbi:hypothetical protein ACFVRT_15910 [Arthrobacter koreensis]|uniref:hypothetical protein n=1 Tax=Arthrobacter koreensis TaxID=199136 RepID=UPI0036DB5829